jgi:glucose/arabinose dehydrogenase
VNLAWLMARTAPRNTSLGIAALILFCSFGPLAAAAAAATTEWTRVATENQPFTLGVPGPQTVRYGSGSSWVSKTVSGSGQCTNTFFGTDPLVGTGKECQLATVWTRVASEGQSFTLTAPGAQQVRYGGGTSWVTKTLTGSGECTNAFFGRDPLVGTGKECQAASSAAGLTDTQAPTPPSGLAIANLTCRSATLSWKASSDNVGVTAYDIYHDGQLMQSVGGSTLSTVIRLKPGVTWGLYVNARDAAGNVSQASATLSVTVPPCVTDTKAPTTPTGLNGSASGTTATLTWLPSKDNVGVAGYLVYRNGVKVATTPGTSYIDSALAANTTYHYAVAARDAQGNTSSRSKKTSVTTGASCTNAICEVKQIATDTDIPWGLVTLPDGNIIYSRRDADNLVLLNAATGAKTDVGTVPDVAQTDGEGGLLGLAVTRDFPARDPWIYIYHTTETDNRIVRIKYIGGQLDNTTLQVLLSGIGRNKYHNGGRLRFGPDGMLYASTGDAQSDTTSQDISNLNGKVLRLTPDGLVPAGNPFNNYVWSYGHRNPQGLAFDAQGRLWEQEFGNGAQDETNLIVAGGNYGWPECEGTVSVSGAGCTPYVAPKFTYATADGSCSGIAIVQGALYVACERGTRLYRHVITGDSLTDTQQLLVGTYGRLRTVEPSIDGALWLTTSTTGDKDSIADNSDEKIFKVLLGR